MRVLIAGTGPSESAVRERARALGIEDAVQFCGHVDDSELGLIYSAADVSVVPSIAHEGFGLVVLESLACGTPVIASNLDGLPEALGGLDGSLLFPPGDPSALGRRLREAIGAKDGLPSREECRRYALRFDWSEVARRHRHYYREVYRNVGTPLLRKTRIVWCDHTARLSGGELAMARVLPSLQSHVDVHVILGETGPLVDMLEQAGMSVEIVPMPSRGRDVSRLDVLSRRLPLGAVVDSLVFAIRLHRRLQLLRPDIVHANSLKAGVVCCLATIRTGAAFVWSVHDYLAPPYLPPATASALRMLARHMPSVVVANSAGTRAALGSQFNTCTVIPPAIDPNLEFPRRVDESRPFIAAMVGRIAPWKGQDVFLRSFAAAFPHGSERAFIAGIPMFGEEDERFLCYLDSLCRELGLERRVTFMGHQNVGEVLRDADVLVHASVIPEPFGQVVVEAMAAGVPVIAAAAGGPAEIVIHNETGLLCPPGDVMRYAEALARLRQYPDFAKRLSSSARPVAHRFYPTVVADELASLYRLVLECAEA